MFGMGTGVAPPLWPPEILFVKGIATPTITVDGRQSNDRQPLKYSIANTSKLNPSPRPISTGRLNALLRLHLRPINVVVWPRALPG